ncbi:MAG: HNH endonuclease, partial [Chitinophagaceae bacterium]
MDLLSTYVRKLSQLKRASVKGAKAPHKPILLLSIIEGITKGEINCNEIKISADLVATFKDYWSQLVKDNRFSENFSLPFFHLQSEGFWHLRTLPGREVLLTTSHSIKSFSHLKEVIAFAYLDETLF